MNIRTRIKTPFSPVAAIEAKPVKRTYASYSEKYLGERMRKLAKAEGHSKSLPVNKTEAMRNLGVPKPDRRKGTITQAVHDILREISPATISEIAVRSNGLTNNQVSTALATLRKGGEATLISQQATQQGGVTVWKAT